MFAAHNDNVEVVRLLLSKGADVNAKNSDGDTALTDAAKKGHVGVVVLLRQAGAQG